MRHAVEQGAVAALRRSRVPALRAAWRMPTLPGIVAPLRVAKRAGRGRRVVTEEPLWRPTAQERARSAAMRGGTDAARLWTAPRRRNTPLPRRLPHPAETPGPAGRVGTAAMAGKPKSRLRALATAGSSTAAARRRGLAGHAPAGAGGAAPAAPAPHTRLALQAGGAPTRMSWRAAPALRLPQDQAAPMAPAVGEAATRRLAAVARVMAPRRLGSAVAPTAQASSANAVSEDASAGRPTATGLAAAGMDEARLGRWIDDHLARAVLRPPAGLTGMDERLTPVFPGASFG